MQKLLIATQNTGKQEELQALLQGLGVTLLVPGDLDLDIVVEEIGQGYPENARLKALAFAEASGYWALADDSGLEVEELQGRPGPRSARLAGSNASDADRRGMLLEMLRPIPRPWKALFRSVVALANPQGEVHFSEGLCRGEIIPAPKGTGGFGYDPIFMLEGTQLTMAELSMEKKNKVSHRARAVQGLLPVLQLLLEQQDRQA